MKVSEIKQKTSFKGWDKNAKALLKVAIAKLPQGKQEEAIGLVNFLEKNSPYHTLEFSGGKLYATKKIEAANGFGKDADGKIFYTFYRGLKKLTNFIIRENKKVPKKEETMRHLAEELKFTDSQERLFESGIKIRKEDLPAITSAFAEKPKQTQQFVEQMKRIDEKSIDAGLGITINPFGVIVRKHSQLNTIYRINFISEALRHKKDLGMAQALKRTEKFIDRYTKKLNRAIIKEDKSYKKELRELARSQNTIKKDSELVKFIRGIINKVRNAVKIKQAKKQAAIQTKANEIANKLDF